MNSTAVLPQFNAAAAARRKLGLQPDKLAGKEDKSVKTTTPAGFQSKKKAASHGGFPDRHRA
ncbi:hypothetical protein [Collimonas humicola]|uniref:hypothetical protein n=1 Tax=Collimonas humicola TaxID=2825886 RepID=UPI001B8D202A|nr:hypothetical protein [Collimonas humicola]